MAAWIARSAGAFSAVAGAGRNDSDGCDPIADRTRDTYTPRPADLGHTLRVRVIATNVAGESDPVRSAPSGVVAPN